MKILVISDTHLSDKFVPEKFNYLRKIIKQADKVIINGDLWEGYLISFPQFLASEWQQLFPLLRSKHTTYITGNHDHFREVETHPYDRFAQELKLHLEFEISGQKYFVTHGHLMLPLHNSWIERKLFHQTALSQTILDFERFFVNKLGKHYLHHAYGHENKLLKFWKRTHLSPSINFITGHTHLQEEKPGQGFYNSGVFKYGMAQFLWITDAGVEVVDGRYL